MMMMKDGIATLASRDTTMARIADAIYSSGSVNGEIDKPVIDRTGLTGTFDVDLAWAPETISSGDGTPPVAVTNSNAPSLFTALQEQLGLKLESTKTSTNVLVIDRVERLTQD